MLLATTPQNFHIPDNQMIECQFRFSYHEGVTYSDKFVASDTIGQIIDSLKDSWPAALEGKVDKNSVAFKVLLQGKRLKNEDVLKDCDSVKLALLHNMPILFQISFSDLPPPTTDQQERNMCDCNLM